MKLRQDQIENVKRIVARHLDRIHHDVCAPESKIACIIRHPGFPDGYLLVTDDDPKELRAVLDSVLSKHKMGEVPPPPPIVED